MNIIERLHDWKRRYLQRVNLEQMPVLSTIRSTAMAMARKSYMPDIHGHKMFLDSQDSLGLSWYKTFEPVETDFFIKTIKPGQVVLDIGANIGYFTLLFARAVGNTGHVFSFEPDPSNHDILRKNIDINGYKNVTLVKKAVSNRDGLSRLFLNQHNRGDNSLFQGEDHKIEVPVETIKLDTFFKTLTQPISVIKMDIQGAEYWALEGMIDLLNRNPHIILVTEYMPKMLRTSEISPSQFPKKLSQLGFRFQKVDLEKKQLAPLTLDILFKDYPDDDPRNLVNLVCTRG